MKIVKSTIFGSLVAISIIHIVRPEVELAVLIVDWMASCILVGPLRVSAIAYLLEGRFARRVCINTLAHGAGEHGAAVARHLLLNADLGHRIVGFIDDSPEKVGKSIQGIPVMGDLYVLPDVLLKMSVGELVVTFANPDGDLVRSVFCVCRCSGVRCRIVPGMSETVMTGENRVVRNIDIADSCAVRSEASTRPSSDSSARGRRVLITGAAGSIGSEIFRQVLSYEPGALAAIDHSEFGLYQLDEEVAKHPLKLALFFPAGRYEVSGPRRCGVRVVQARHRLSCRGVQARAHPRAGRSSGGAQLRREKKNVVEAGAAGRCRAFRLHLDR